MQKHKLIMQRIIIGYARKETDQPLNSNLFGIATLAALASIYRHSEVDFQYKKKSSF